MPMPRTVVYQGFELTARPRHKLGKWTTELLIRRNEVVKQFTASDTYDTEEDAVIHSLDFGRRLIDGDVPDFDSLWIS